MTLTQFRSIGTLVLVALFAMVFLVSWDASAKKKKKKGKKAKAAAVETETADTSETETGAADSADDPQAVAREKYAEGKSLYDAGKFDDALVAFQAAYDAKPHPIVLKSIAECQAQSGDVSAAIATLEKYLADPEATDKGVVEARIEELKNAPSKVSITSEPPGAKIEVAGVDTEEVTPATLELTPGEYAVRLSVEGMTPVQKNISVISGQESNLAVDMAQEGSGAATQEAIVDPFDSEPEPPAPELSDENSGPPTAFWAMAAVAGGGLVTGTVFGTMALGDEDDYHDEPTQAKKEAGQRDAIIADVSFGLAAAAAIAGTVIMVVHHKKSKNETAGLTVVPVASRSAAGMSAVIDF